ncbi:hypothetical protein BY996DRAFT_7107252 [Phakopsora pachyrhizi]|nr:hypothetical protein BY996DRAFT_7107252 [Phakopsora pachyrhizi]
MIPSPESTSVLSEFKRKGNILLAALGDSSSKGPGRIPFSSQAGSPSSVPSDQEKAQIVEEKANEENNNDGSEIEERLKKILKYLKESIEKKDENKDDRVGSESGTIKSSAKGKGGLEEGKEKISDEERDRIDEEIGKFWKVTSEYRRKAQEEKMGQYSIQGDGTRRENNLEEEGKGSGTIEDLPDADPDSKEGLTPEIWEAIKQKFSSDDLTVMLNSVRKKEADVK